MIAYKYDNTTFEYIGQEACYADPMSLDIIKKKAAGMDNESIALKLGLSVSIVNAVLDKGEPDMLMPANSTLVKPPQSEPYTCQVYKNGSWVLVNDYRGIVVKAQDGTNRSVTITELGVVPSDITFEPLPVQEEYVDITEVVKLLRDVVVSGRALTEEEKLLLMKV